MARRSSRANLEGEKRRHRIEWEPGSVFGMALGDGTFALGQVLHSEEHGGTAPMVLLDVRQSILALPKSDVMMLGRASVAVNELDRGSWPVLGVAAIKLKNSEWPNAKQRETGNWIGSVWITPGLFERFAKACWGVIPWNSMHDPQYFEKYLLPGRPRPKSLVMKPRADE